MSDWTKKIEVGRSEQPMFCSHDTETGNERSLAVLRYLRLLVQAGEHFNQQLQRDYRVSQGQLACLHMLRQDGSMPISRLAKGLCVEPSTVTGVVDRLEQKGLVRRTRQGPDRRVITIELTETGSTLAENAPPSVPSFLRIGMKELTEQEAAAIVDALAKLVEMLQRHSTFSKEPAPDPFQSETMR